MTVQLFINGSLVDLEGREAVVLTKSVFNLNDLASRTSDYSNVFQVPKTQNNRLIFKSAGIVNSFNDEPYDQLRATLKVDGVEVAQGIAELQSSDGDYFRVNIQSGNGSFNKAIKSLTLNDLETYLTPLDHTYNATEVSARRDLSAELVYPNVDYGWFERATLGDQPHEYFYPALYVKYIVDSAIKELGYKQVGSFWTNTIYSRLAIMAKDIISDADSFFVSYKINSGNNFFITRGTQTFPDSYEITSPLNFPEELSDEDGLYVDTALGLGYITFGYNFPVNFGTDTTWQINLNGTVNIDNIRFDFRDNFIEEANLVIRLEIWNKNTNTFVDTAVEIFYTFYSVQYVDRGGVTTVLPATEQFFDTFDISEAINDPSNLNSIGSTATDHALVWFVDVLTTTTTLEPVSTYNSFDAIAVNLEFEINQATGGDPSAVSVVNSFDDISIGSLFLYLCNVTGVFPLVDEGMKTIEMISFDEIRKNKANAIDWSKKIDLSQDPNISFKLNYAQNNLFNYDNDQNDVWLKELTNYGQGIILVDNGNMQKETVKYSSPFSLCAISPTFDSARSMAKIYTGDKYVFNGIDYDLDPEATIGGFSTRIVLLSRVTDNLIQITGGSTVTGNYEVNNVPILFDYVIRNEYSLIQGVLDKSKVVQAIFNIDAVDFETFDFKRPVYIDYFNDYFYVNEISQFKVNEKDSTQLTLIRL